MRYPFIRLLFIPLFVLAGALPASRISAEQAAPASKIVSVAFIGNTVTRESTLRLFMQSLDLDTGSLYDSAKADYAKKKLRATNLFSKVDILTIFKDDGVHLTLAVRENFYLIPEGVGGGYYTRKYGRSDLWYRLQLGFTKYNFRGRMETFSVESSLWDYRALGLSWTKPLYPSPYYIALSAAGVYGPELNLPQNRFSVSGKIAVGRKLSIHSRGFVGVIPMQTRVDGLDGSAIKRYRELVSFAGAAADFRGDSYEPRGGWLAYGDFKSNALYSDSTPKYGQFTTELRWYRSGFFTRDRFALRLQSALRTNDAGGFKRIYIGGESTVRGFPSGWLGQPDIMNNYAMISAEYRFFLFRTPVINPWRLFDRFAELRGLILETDGTLIADAGHLWHDVGRPFDRRQNGGGIGAGIRIKAPTLRLTGCIDAVFPITKETRPESSYYLRTVIYMPPELHVYLSLF